jgi:hypothetical protein
VSDGAGVDVAEVGLLAEAGLVRRFSAEGTDVWENPAARPRAYVTGDVVQVRNADEALEWLVNRAGGSSGTVVSHDAPGLYYPGPEALRNSVFTPTRSVRAEFVPGRTQVTVDGGLGLLVVNDLFYPGWVATVDGQPATILRTNHLFMGVPLPADDYAHQVVLEYKPPSVALGGIVSFATIALLGLVFALAELLVRMAMRSPRRDSGEPDFIR